MRRDSLVKDAFKITFGVYLGKKAAEFVADVGSDIVVKIGEPIIIKWAAEGRKSAREYCKKYGIEYQTYTDGGNEHGESSFDS